VRESDLHEKFKAWRAELDETIAAEQLTKNQAMVLAGELGQALLTLSDTIRQLQIQIDQRRKEERGGDL
jgi:hypothetical protein